MSTQLTARPSDIPLQNLYNLLQPITIDKRSPRARFINWGRTFQCSPLSVFEPENEFQCELIVELAKREGQVLRAVGVGHSPSDLACTKGFMLRTTKLNRILEVRPVAHLSSFTPNKRSSRSTPKSDTLSLKAGSLFILYTLSWPKITLP